MIIMTHTHTHCAQLLAFSQFKLHWIFISAKHSWFPLHSKTDSFYLKLVLWNVEGGDTELKNKRKLYYCGFSALMSFDLQCQGSIKHFIMSFFLWFSLVRLIKSSPVLWKCSPDCMTSMTTSEVLLMTMCIFLSFWLKTDKDENK